MQDTSTTDQADYDSVVDTLAYDLADLFETHHYPIPAGVDTDQIRAALPAFLAALGITPPTTPDVRHTCNRTKPGQALPFGRLAPAGKCGRCDQLRAGAPAKDRPAYLDAVDRRRRDEEQTRADIRDHFAPGSPHSRGECGPVCTAFDW